MSAGQGIAAFQLIHHALTSMETFLSSLSATDGNVLSARVVLFVEPQRTTTNYCSVMTVIAVIIRIVSCRP
ncbi:hypothetical protein V3C99_018582 [Haemonchus contortus]